MDLKTRRSKFRFLLLLLVAALAVAAPAFAGGLDHAETSGNNFLSSLKVIIPVFFVIAMTVLGVLYANKVVGKDALISWFKGLLLAGSAGEIVSLFLF